MKSPIILKGGGKVVDGKIVERWQVSEKHDDEMGLLVLVFLVGVVVGVLLIAGFR